LLYKFLFYLIIIILIALIQHQGQTKHLLGSVIEGSNIEYGNIEKCYIDTNLTSKIWRLVTSKKSDGNIQFIIDFFNINTKEGSNGVPRGVKGGHSIPYHHQKSPPLHGGPRLTLTETVLVTKYR